jgi:hypothetical protein
MEMSKKRKAQEAIIQPSGDTKIGEDTDQLDELSKNTLRSYANKALTDVVSNSTAAGYSDAKNYPTKDYTKKVVNRSTGMRNAVQRLAKEDVEQIDELSKGTLASYIKARDNDPTKINDYNERDKRNKNVQTAINKYLQKDKDSTIDEKKIKNEDTDLEEAHQVVAKTKEGETMRSAVYPTKKQAMDMHYKMAKNNKYVKVDTHKVENNMKEENNSSMGLYLAAIAGNTDLRGGLYEKKLTPAELKKREEVAQAIDRDDPGMGMSKKMAIATATAKKVAESKAHTVPKTEKEKDLAKMAPPHDKITHADVMVGRGVKKEETGDKPFDDMMKKVTKTPTAKARNAERILQKRDAQARLRSGEYGFGPSPANKLGIRKQGSMREETLNESHFKLGDKVECLDSGMTGIVVLMDTQHGAEDEKYYTVQRSDGKMMKYAPNELTLAMSEEVESIDELSKDTLGNYVKKATKNAVVRGRLSKEFDNDSRRSKNPDMRLAKQNLARDFANDSQKRQDGVGKAVDRLTKEDVELDEGDMPFKGPYTKAKGTITDKSGAKHDEMSRVRDLARKAMEKQQKKAEPVKEESDLDEAMISYSDFTDKIAMHRKAGNKVVDDKYTSGKAHYTTVDADGHGRKVTHTPTGQKAESLGKMQADDDEATEVAPTQQRGRGRPSGSKSGGKYK